jgi:DNA-binding GntR family transcriptional regulator
VRPYLSIFAARKTEFSKDEREHRALIKFCRRKDVSRARQVIDKHLADTRDMVLTTIANDAQAVQQRKVRPRAVVAKAG